MLSYITVLLVCQLAGEVIARLARLPVPGPVIGMVLLFLGLAIKGRVPEGLDKVAGGLLSHLALLFVPAGVGVTLHLSLISQEWLPIAASLVLATLATILVTGGVTAWLLKRGRS